MRILHAVCILLMLISVTGAEAQTLSILPPIKGFMTMLSSYLKRAKYGAAQKKLDVFLSS